VAAGADTGAGAGDAEGERAVVSSTAAEDFLDGPDARFEAPLDPAVHKRGVLAGDTDPSLGFDNVSVEFGVLSGEEPSVRVRRPAVLVPAPELALGNHPLGRQLRVELRDLAPDLGDDLLLGSGGEPAGGDPPAVAGQEDLGVMLIELLTGRSLYETALSKPALTPVTIQLRVADKDPLPVPWLVRLSIPRDLDTVCQRRLDKSRDGRYARTRDVAEDRHRFLRGEPVTARPLGAVSRVARCALSRCARTAPLRSDRRGS
jgi:hypothetical protein